MATWNPPHRTLALGLAAAALVIPLANARADVVIGDWENGSTDGWIDWGSGQSAISAPAYTFATDVGVTHGSSSLKLTKSGWNQTLSIKLHETGHKADFFANKKFQIDVSFAATTASGWAEVYQLWINAEGYGFTGQAPAAPVMQWGWGEGGGPARTSTLTFDYSALVDGDPGNGEIPASANWIEFIFATNNDGVHDTFYFDNARLTGSVIPGDANLNGKIDPDDFALLDRGFAAHLTGWANGDFNNDNVIDAADYLLIDTSYAQQLGGPAPVSLLAQRQATFGDAYVAQLLASVPEPSSLLAALGLTLLPFSRRRRV